MTLVFPLRLSAALLPLAVVACNGGMAAYPSLAQRPAERAFAAEAAPTVPRAQEARADPALLSQIARLRTEATHAHARFALVADDAARKAQAAHGTSLGSDTWAAAIVALAALDSARSDTALALADLDALRANTAVASAQSNDPLGHANFAAITEADSAVAALVAQEDARIAALHQKMDD